MCSGRLGLATSTSTVATQWSLLTWIPIVIRTHLAFELRLYDHRFRCLSIPKDQLPDGSLPAGPNDVKGQNQRDYIVGSVRSRGLLRQLPKVALITKQLMNQAVVERMPTAIENQVTNDLFTA